MVEKCCVCGEANNVRRCGGCHAAKYCSKGCQKSHHEYHAVYCGAINQLESLEKEKLYGSSSVREKQLDFLRQAKIAKLVGQKPILTCQLSGKTAEVLWDTGSMISLVDRSGLLKIYLTRKFMQFQSS